MRILSFNSSKVQFELEQRSEITLIVTFQFQQGTIWTRVWKRNRQTSCSFNSSKVQFERTQRSGINSASSSFNSSKVQFELLFHCPVHKVLKFQFQQGTIWTWSFQRGLKSVLVVSIPARYNLNLGEQAVTAAEIVFQFQQGTIWTVSHLVGVAWALLFQFQQGTIWTLKAPLTQRPVARFNSSKVQFERFRHSNICLSVNSFNSSKVQFEQAARIAANLSFAVSIPARYNLNGNPLFVSNKDCKVSIPARYNLNNGGRPYCSLVKGVSIPARYNLNASRILIESVHHEFQFQQGTIWTTEEQRMTRRKNKFQFQQGTIWTCVSWQRGRMLRKFQFQQGTIWTFRPRFLWIETSQVSIPARYNLNNLRLSKFFGFPCFNSSKVQFERVQTYSKTSQVTLFQFQQGTIWTKTMFKKDDVIVVSIPARYNLNCCLCLMISLVLRFNSSKVQFEPADAILDRPLFMFQFQQGTIWTKKWLMCL